MGAILFGLCIAIDIPIIVAVCNWFLPTAEDWSEAFWDSFRPRVFWRTYAEQMSALRLQICLIVAIGLPVAQFQAIHYYLGK